MNNLPTIAQERGIEAPKWETLTKVLFPESSASMVALAVDYCKASGFDIMKRPVYIIKYAGKEQIVPSIGLYRTTAARTGNYAGIDAPEYEIDGNVILACHVTVYRLINGVRCPFVGSCYREMRKDTQTWKGMERRMFAIRAETDALRKAFPEEIGAEPTYEEMQLIQKEEEAGVAGGLTDEQKRLMTELLLGATEEKQTGFQQKYGTVESVPPRHFHIVIETLKKNQAPQELQAAEVMEADYAHS